MSEGETSSVPVGNYKGVMLCNRPFGGAADALDRGISDHSAFRSGIVPDPWGVTPISKYRDEKKAKAVPAILKHKQWLAELQKAKELVGFGLSHSMQVRMQESLEECGRDDQTLRFHRHEEKLRRKVQQTIHEAEAAADASESKRSESKEEERSSPPRPPRAKMSLSPPPQESKQQEEEEEGRERAACSCSCGEEREEESKSVRGEAPESKRGGGEAAESSRRRVAPPKKARPMWAYTEEGHAEKVREEEEEEVENLLDFVEGLDFEEYVDDLEVRSALQKMRNRIEELARPKPRGEDLLNPGDLHEDNFFLRNPESEGRAGGVGKDGDAGEEDDDAESAAVEAIYEENPSLRGIHSKSSLREKVRQLKQQQQQQLSSAVRRGEEEEEDAYTGPRIVEIAEDGGTRISNKSYPGNLPYLHRNPAV